MTNQIPDIKGEKVLVCPLNWGLGHASRCIPIIKRLAGEGKKVYVGAEGAALVLLIKELNGTDIERFIELKGISAKYSKGKSQTWAIIKRLPKWTGEIIEEHKDIKRIVGERGIDTVISDNRFGAWCKKAKSIYITHQVAIKAPRGFKWSEPIIRWIHGRIIKRYDECWIPDREQDGISGELSHQPNLPANCKFIGTLSRLADINPSDINPDEQADTVAIISGPEPQRSIFEKEVAEAQKANGEKTLIIRGTPQKDATEKDGNLTLVPHMDPATLKAQLLGAKRVICRSGYSTMMDLDAIGVSAEICPTPGQSEQEYLAEYLTEKKTHRRWEKPKTDSRN
ncbi:MAG: hypothetical protein ILP23_01680 [Paludibacteraceae bacterium]|nr:hypothetical protein [Paludibacteraceae bacterium]